jgi:hypothetical protein
MTRLALVLLLLAQTGWPQGVIRLKTRNLVPVASPGTVSPVRFPPKVVRHYLVLFASYPGPDVLAALAARGIQVVSYVPENALMVSASVLNLRGLNVTWAGPMDPADKISPAIAAQAAGAYLVIFQPDTSMDTNRDVVGNQGFTIIDNADLLAGQLLVSGAFSALPSLAALDQVAYILPASAELQSGDALMGCAGALTQAGPVAQYVQAAGGWSKDASGGVVLTYFLDSVTPKLDETVLRGEIARAFAEWARYANITITPASQPNMPRSIDILFARFAHGDAYPFDGPGGALAHTFYPAPDNAEPVAGDMHLDADESWSVGAGGVDLFSVALHETGHALGLGHSDNPGAVMYPYYRLQTGLTADDIAGIQAIYGKSGATSAPPSTGAGNTGTAGTSGGGNTGTGTAGTGTTGTGSGTGSGTVPAVDTVPPTLSIVFPNSTIASAYASTIPINGTAGDNVGVTAVKWTTSTGGAGVATGTTSWSAVVPLLVGDNVVTVRAYDAAGNSSWRAVTVVRH